MNAPILVVEDDAGIRSFITAVLDDEGFDVATAADGLDAIVWLRDHRPALVLLDLDLPKVPGEGVLVELRALYHNQVPVITMTAREPSAEGMLKRGVSTHLSKPFLIDDMLDAIHKNL